jgi:hypothetical protein
MRYCSSVRLGSGSLLTTFFKSSCAPNHNHDRDQHLACACVRVRACRVCVCGSYLVLVKILFGALELDEVVVHVVGEQRLR